MAEEIKNNILTWLSRKKRSQIFHKHIGKISLFMLLVLICLIVYYYNILVVLKQRVHAAQSQVEAAMQMRENLFPILIKTVKDFVKHEDDIFIHAADVRAKLMQRKPPDKRKEGPPKKEKSGTDWEAIFSQILAIAEEYPDLKTSEPFQISMEKFTEVEKEIFQRRMEYNDFARDYNSHIRTMPTGLIAATFSFKEVPYYEKGDKAEWVPAGEARRAGE